MVCKQTKTASSKILAVIFVGKSHKYVDNNNIYII